MNETPVISAQNVTKLFELASFKTLDDVECVAVSPDGKWIAAGQGDDHGSVQVWSWPASALLHTLQGHDSLLRGIDFSPDSARLASASADGLIKLWNLDTGKEVRTLRGHRGEARGVAFSPDGKLIASAGKDNTVRIWDPATGKELRNLDKHQDSVWVVAFSPQGDQLASGSEDATARLWQPATGKELRQLSGPATDVLCLAFSPDGKFLASGSFDGTIRIWNVATGKDTIYFKAHPDKIWGVAYTQDGQALASASVDHTIKFWQAATGEELHSIENHDDLVMSIAFSPDGTRLVSGSLDKTVRVWGLQKELPSGKPATEKPAAPQPPAPSSTYSDRLSQYVTDLFAREDAALLRARVDSTAQGLPAINIKPEEGRFLQFLVAAVNAKKAVEIGTLGGYSGTWLARGLPSGGKLITLEADPRHAAVAAENFRVAGVSSMVEIRIGNAHQTLKTLAAEGPFDFAFIDAEKPGYDAYLNWAVENVRIGGVIAAHNAFRKGSVFGVGGSDEHTATMQAFNKRVASHPRLISTIFPAGDGMVIAVKVK